MSNPSFLVSIALLSLAACGPAPGAGPGAFASDFKTKGFFTQMSKAVDNSGKDAAVFVHKLQRTWYSDNVKDLLGDKELPIGTTAIKETYSAEGVVGGLYVMTKKSKDTWTYQVRSADGAVDAQAPSGDNATGCHGCHTKGAPTDYLLGTAEKS